MRGLIAALACWLPGVAPAYADAAPLLIEFETPVGQIQLEILSLDELERRGAVIPTLEKATPDFSPSTTFDRTDAIIDYVLAVPVLRF